MVKYKTLFLALLGSIFSFALLIPGASWAITFDGPEADGTYRSGQNCDELEPLLISPGFLDRFLILIAAISFFFGLLIVMLGEVMRRRKLDRNVIGAVLILLLTAPVVADASCAAVVIISKTGEMIIAVVGGLFLGIVVGVVAKWLAKKIAKNKKKDKS